MNIICVEAYDAAELESKYIIKDGITDMYFILLQNGFSEEDINHTVTEWSSSSYKQYFDYMLEMPSETLWNYRNAFFFAFHLCSTIGYGDISPKTAYGQMLAVSYATVGIPLHILLFKLLGESFAQNYQEMVGVIRGEDQSKRKKILADCCFFIPWSVVFFILPAVVFMHTENWNIIEGVYYSFITLSTVGLGDYVAGLYLENNCVYYVYKFFLLCWMLYGLAFNSMLVDIFTHRYQMHLLWAIKCECEKKCEFKIERVYVDVEKLDIHFRLVRYQGVHHRFNIWAIRKGTQKDVDFQMSHLGTLAVLAELMQGELLKHLDDQESSRHDAFPVRARSGE